MKIIHWLFVVFALLNRNQICKQSDIDFYIKKDRIYHCSIVENE
jgi:hypothetical protein